MRTDIQNARLFEEYGRALRDGVYETFMEVTGTTDLKEMREAGFRVMEIPFSSSPLELDKLLALHKDGVIKTGCTVTVEKGEVKVKSFTGLETKELMRKIQAANGRQ